MWVHTEVTEVTEVTKVFKDFQERGWKSGRSDKFYISLVTSV